MNIRIILMALLVLPLIAAFGAAVDPDESFNAAGALYSKSVDLANEGQYQEALDAADQALAMNVTSLIGLIQSNRAGILVMLHRNDEAITAADAALAVEGNLTTVHSIAWYNKGNALRALGRITDAQDAYSRAYALDNSLVPPDMSSDTPVPSPATIAMTMSPLTTTNPSALTSPLPQATPQSPLPGTACIAPVVLALLFCACQRK
jgi:tetratricopeptide (TPR) repeat protein